MQYQLQKLVRPLKAFQKYFRIIRNLVELAISIKSYEFLLYISMVCIKIYFHLFFSFIDTECDLSTFYLLRIYIYSNL